MQVILLKDVAKLGRRFDVVSVPNGHALNKLIPAGMAQAATKENLKRIEVQKSRSKDSEAAKDANFAAALESLNGKEVTIKREANEQGHLYESVKEQAIAKALKDEGASVEVSQILIPVPIKQVGTYEIELHSGEARGSVTVNVEAA